jgi:archaellum component FlaG (FlaF/FlaG flagellin family)
MGAETSMTHGIFFISSVIIALAVVGVMTVSVNSLAHSFGAKAGDFSEQIKTEVKITGDTCFLGGSKSVYVKNTGSSYIDANLTAIFVNGSMQRISSIEIRNGNSWSLYAGIGIWAPYDIVRFNTTDTLPTGYNKLRVVTVNGIYDSVEYSDC